MNLVLGSPYSRKDLGILLNENIEGTQEGIFYCKRGNNGATLLFVTLNKEGRKEHLQFNDYFEDDLFHWDSQPKQSIGVPTIKAITEGKSSVFLFARVDAKNKSVTNPYIYCGLLNYLDYDSSTAKPVHLIFQSDEFDYDNASVDLKKIYDWSPDINKTRPISSSVIKKAFEVKSQRGTNKPKETSKYRFQNTRVGQDWYRAQLLNVWEHKCAVTGFSNPKVLIASHIKPWSLCSEEEKLDENNGILLSPSLDALFDKYLISFQDSGEIIINPNISDEEAAKLGVHRQMKIRNIGEGMLKYLKEHRVKFLNSKEL
jgi:hypothetical protein|uniref:DUF3427 domain-containing protein n=1 Tax=Algoriphagus sp. TaxID=1872435 RepID=UPI00404787A3